MRILFIKILCRRSFAIFCSVGIFALPSEAQQSDVVNKCTTNGQIVFQSEACPSATPKNNPSSLKIKPSGHSKQRDPETMRAEADARRAVETKRRDEIQQGFRDPAAPTAAVVMPGAAPISQSDGSSISKSSAIDRMTTYTTFLGRGIGCGVSGTEAASSRFGLWMDSQGLTKKYLLVAAAGIKMAAEQQRAGNSPDSCSKVREQFAAFPWP
jgi:hypothetical protein